ncbi:protein SPMIP1 [Neosynchiropus ocellatus]
MRGLLTTRSQNAYREQIKKETLTRLAWKNRYAELYPSCCGECKPPPEAPREPRVATLPPIVRPPEVQPDLPPAASPQEELRVPPLMRPVSPTTRRTLFQDSSGQGKGRSLYLQRRSQLPPEEKFDFPLLSSWDYGWRLGDYTLAHRPPSCPRSSVVKNTFYSRNGVFSS